MATHITDLPVDVMSKIISVVAKKHGGARMVARSMATCKLFLEASNSSAVRRVVNFEYMLIFLRSLHLFQNKNGLLSKCAKTYNPSAELQLARVILITSNKLGELNMNKERLNLFRDYRPRGRGRPRDDAVMASFITHFTPAPGTDPNPSQAPVPRPLLYHWEFVKVFILKAKPLDVFYMSSPVHKYIMLFTALEFYSVDVGKFLSLYDLWFSSGSPCITLWDYFSFCPCNREMTNEQIRAMVLFEELRVKVLHAFEVIIPKLH